MIRAALLLSSFLLGCDGEPEAPATATDEVIETRPAAEAPAPPPTEPGPAPAAPTARWRGPDRDNAGGATCEVSEPLLLDEVPTRRVGVALGVGEHVALALWSTSAAVRARPIASDGGTSGETVETPMPKAIRMIAGAVDEAVLVFAAADGCGPYGASCFNALALDASGDRLAKTEGVDGGQWAQVDTSIVGNGALYVAQSWRMGRGLTRRFSVNEGAFSVETVFEWRVACSGGRNFDALTTRSGQTVAITTYEELCETPRTLLFEGGEPTRVVGLPRDITVTRLAAIEDAVDLVFRPVDPETGEVKGLARYVRLGTDGRPIATPVIASNMATLPPAMRTGIYAELELAGGDLRMRREDAAGVAVGEPISLGRVRGIGRDAPHALAWNGDRFVVIYGTIEEGRWNVILRSLRCAAG